MNIDTILQGDCLEGMADLDESSIDLIVTDPPYGYSFMGKDWDKAVPSVDIWKQCLRVLKPGAFAFIMSAPRMDVQTQMAMRIQEAGFDVAFTPLYWAYASGFPKAMNISKAVDKRNALGVSDNIRPICRHIRKAMDERRLTSKDIAPHFGFNPRMVDHWAARDTDSQPTVPTAEQYTKLKEILKLDGSMDDMVAEFNTIKGQYGEAWENREVTGEYTTDMGGFQDMRMGNMGPRKDIPNLPQAKALDGSYAGFQPKPAVEVIIVAMKPLSEKTYVDQALANGKGITWLDDGRIPHGGDSDMGDWDPFKGHQSPDAIRKNFEDTRKDNFADGVDNGINGSGRFPANLLVSDDVLDDGKKHIGTGGLNPQKPSEEWTPFHEETNRPYFNYGDSGGFSRYFSLDAWYEKRIKDLPKEVKATFPFLIVPKASKSEKNKGCDALPPKQNIGGGGTLNPECANKFGSVDSPSSNFHPTVKPLKLMSYLISIGSRPGDIVLDPFAGSGTTLLAAKQLARKFIGFEIMKEYSEIAEARLRDAMKQRTIMDFTEANE